MQVAETREDNDFAVSMDCHDFDSVRPGVTPEVVLSCASACGYQNRPNRHVRTRNPLIERSLHKELPQRVSRSQIPIFTNLRQMLYEIPQPKQSIASAELSAGAVYLKPQNTREAVAKGCPYRC
jgi:hypothetical protein